MINVTDNLYIKQGNSSIKSAGYNGACTVIKNPEWGEEFSNP